jgi:hypothetical protein
VLVVDPTGKPRSEAFFSTDSSLAPQKIIEYYVLRWNVEVTRGASAPRAGNPAPVV